MCCPCILECIAMQFSSGGFFFYHVDVYFSHIFIRLYATCTVDENSELSGIHIANFQLWISFAIDGSYAHIIELCIVYENLKLMLVSDSGFSPVN